MSKYQTHTNSLKSQSYIIIGYAKKSPGHEGKQKRIDLLNCVVRCLMERSMCDKIFVSSSYLASDSLTSMDINEKIDLLAELTRVDRNTKYDFLYQCNRTEYLPRSSRFCRNINRCQ
ncbi:unnamed protein product [Rhizopus stolonifer]